MLEQLPISHKTFTNPVKRINLGNGDSASVNTMHLMRNVILSSAENTYVRNFAEDIIEDAEKDDYKRALAIYEYLKNHTKYTHDMRSIEFIKTPPVSLQQLEVGGCPLLDCDDYTVLSLSLLSSLGYKTKMRAVAYKTQKFEHIYGMVMIKGKWVPFDLVNTAGFGKQYSPSLKYLDMEV